MTNTLVYRGFQNSHFLRCFSSISYAIMEKRSYEDAITALNSLQTNAQVLAERRKTRSRLARDNLHDMRTFIERAGVTMEMLDKLSVIHVSGTKGKGSTCAFTESILRHAGYKTGFYSSPHLIEVRERIRLNGKPLSKDLFTKYFFECWDNLQATRDQDEDKMPAYFRFLTLMAFYVFLKEKVDVVVLEVGIGGAYDSTNIIRNPVVCGVTLLGMDHVETLGGSLESIAWQKAGIFKPGVPAFTIKQQESALQVLKERAKEMKNTLQVVPNLDTYPGTIPDLSLEGRHQQANASLALQLTHTWLQHTTTVNNNSTTPPLDGGPVTKRPRQDMKQLVADTFDITDHMRKGLSSAVWMGRTQTIKRPNITFYLDGAHTAKSVEACVEWFKDKADKEKEQINGSVGRVLMFNITGRREPHSLLRPLMSLKFDHAIFTPNSVNLERTDSSDLSNFTVTRDSELRWCVENQRVWMALRGAGFQAHADLDDDHVIQNGHDDGHHSIILPCVAQATRWVAAGRDPLIPMVHSKELDPPECLVKSTHLQVLVVGSLHLVGAVMKVLGTDITGEICYTR